MAGKKISQFDEVFSLQSNAEIPLARLGGNQKISGANLLSTKANVVHSHTAADVGLGNVNNTSDLNKPISTATATALSNKADLIGGKLASSQIPSIAISDFLGVIGSEIAMLALTGERGDWCIRTDESLTYILIDEDASVLGNWVALTGGGGAVLSVNSQTGVVVLSKSDIGLGNVDNVSDLNKPISTATQTALDLKAPINNPTFTGTAQAPTPTLGDDSTKIATTEFVQDTLIAASIPDGDKGDITVSSSGTVWTIDNTVISNSKLANIATKNVIGRTSSGTGVAEYIPIATTLKTDLSLVKADVGLSNVDNTSDSSKPISSATQSALDLKAPLANPTFTGTVNGISKSMVGLGNVDNTSDLNKPISTATQTALNDKADLVGGVLATSQIPAIAITDFLGTVASQVAMLALTGERGDWAIRTDLGSTWILIDEDASILANWKELPTAGAPVLSVNGQTGVVVLSKTDIGLSNVPNTDCTTTANITDSTNKRFVTDTQQTVLSNTSGTNTGDQTITLTGDVTGSGTGSFAATIGSDIVTNSKLANMATATIKGRITGSTGDPEDLSVAQVTSMLDAFVGDSGSGGTKGLVPAPAIGDATKFLKGDGTWATAGGSGDVSKVGTPADNQIGVWTGDGTIEGDAALTFDTATDTLTTVNARLTAIELGHNTDTTISRVSAGRIAVESINVPTISSADTLTNKRITKRVSSEASNATPSVNSDNIDAHVITALAANITSFTISGTPTNEQTFALVITDDGTPRTIALGSSFENGAATIPSTTVTSTRLDMLFKWNTVSNKWRCMATSYGGTAAGDVFKVGTPADNQLGVWTGNGTIEGDSNLTWNGSILGVTGNVGIGHTGFGTAYDRTIGVYGSSHSSLKLMNSTSSTGDTDGFDVILSGVTAFLVNREAGDMRFFTSNTERLTLMTGGNLSLGINTFSSSYDKALNIYGTGHSSLKLSNNTSGTGSSDGLEVIMNGVNASLLNHENGTLDIGTNDATAISIAASRVATFQKAARGVQTALTSSSNNIAIDFNSSNDFLHTFTEDTTLANPSNLTVGQSGFIYLTQHASSPKTLAYGSYWKFVGGTPSVSNTNGAFDTLSYTVRSSTFIEAVLHKGWA